MCANWNPVGDITLISVSAMLAKESYADEHSITRPPTKKTGQGMIPAPFRSFRLCGLLRFHRFQPNEGDQEADCGEDHDGNEDREVTAGRVTDHPRKESTEESADPV